MTQELSPLAGKLAPSSLLTNVPRLITAYYSQQPDPTVSSQRVSFGTSGHRGCAFESSFNEWHILAICQAICEYRSSQKISGPLFLGIDTHALSEPAWASAVEVLAANGVELMISLDDEFTPTPAVSLAILNYNRNRSEGIADGIIITPSHNPPVDGGLKYNPPNGGPAEPAITSAIENRANEILAAQLAGVRIVPLKKALNAQTTHRYNFKDAYIQELSCIIDMQRIRESGVRMGVDALGGAGVNYWSAIADRYDINLTLVSDRVDPTFSFMTVDWDGKIRMDPSSPYTMQNLIGLKERFDVACACDTDHDRHGIITPGSGLMPSNHYLAVCVWYLFQNRPQWRMDAAVGKTIVSSQMIDRVSRSINRSVSEVPVGFKWFVNGLLEGSLGFVGEESAGSAFLRTDGSVWTTDKDGIAAALLAGEITARTGRDPAVIYHELEQQLGQSFYNRVSAPVDLEQKKKLSKLSPEQISARELAGDVVTYAVTRAPSNDAPIGGLKVGTEHGWFAARPSGTEPMYKIYAESFRSQEHLEEIVRQAQTIVSAAIA